MMPSITYVHTAQKETIRIHAVLEKAVRPEIMKDILKVRTYSTNISIQTCQSLIEPSYKSVRYSTQGSRLQHVANAQVRAEYTVMHRVYIVL